jgi:hypothetical protein
MIVKSHELRSALVGFEEQENIGIVEYMHSHFSWNVYFFESISACHGYKGNHLLWVSSAVAGFNFPKKGRVFFTNTAGHSLSSVCNLGFLWPLLCPQ